MRDNLPEIQLTTTYGAVTVTTTPTEVTMTIPVESTDEDILAALVQVSATVGHDDPATDVNTPAGQVWGFPRPRRAAD